MADSDESQELPSPAGDLLAGGPSGLPELPAVGDLTKGLPIDGLTKGLPVGDIGNIGQLTSQLPS